MSEADQDYELEILKMVINQHLDESTSLTEAGLNALETKRDQVVWDVATKIYSQSGYRVELSLVRDIVNSRIRIIKDHLTEEARRAAEQKIQQEAEEARRVAERKAQQEAEEARRAAERKAQQEAEEARRAVWKAQQAAERRKTQQEAEEAFRAGESNPQFLAKRKAEIFIKVRRLISEQFAVDEAEVTLNSHLSNDLGADPLDIMELLLALEKEFDIEISDEDLKKHLDIEYPDMGFFVPSLHRSRLGFPPPSEGKLGEKAIVRNVVELIWENAPYFWENTPH